ncbi:hypothetical protein [Yersinia ruckeri]
MFGIIDIQEQGSNAIETTNGVFSQAGLPLIISRMTHQDLIFCINRSRNSLNPLEWRNIQTDLNRSDGYNFCFKLTVEDEGLNPVPERPEGGCACWYNELSQKVTIEMIQNFDDYDGPLDGKMMIYSLITLIFFLQEVGGVGIYIDQPVNDRVCDYYMNVLKFEDVSGTRTLLYRPIEELVAWYQDLELAIY